MTKRDAREAAALLQMFLAQLAGMAADDVSQAAADLRRAVGALSAAAEARISAGALGTELGAAYAAATDAGATFLQMGRVGRLAATMAPVGNPAIAVVVACLRLSAVEQARILAQTEFRNRVEVDQAQAVFVAVVSSLEEFALDVGDQEVYRALIALRSATVRDLGQRSRVLPRLITYRMNASLPAIALANRLYGEADRSDELRAEGRVPHPLFMPSAGPALSA